MKRVEEIAEALKRKVSEREGEIIQFLREIVAIPSMESQIGEVGRRIGREMEKLGFDDCFFDAMGNIVGRIGNGPVKLLYDSHIDTVGLGDESAWKWDPFEGKIEDGIFYGRGACDEKGSTPGMVYGIALARELGLIDGYTLYYFGNMEEWCDGIAPNSLVETDGIRPDYVVIGEPTRMQIYRGHRGRIELQCRTKGRSCHASMPWLGENAIYKMLPFLRDIEALNEKIPDHPFLGRGTCVASIIECKSPSINAVPDECTVYLDRRTTFGETKEGVVAQIRNLPGAKGVEIEEMFYDTPSYNGFVFKVDKYFPAWCFEESHPFVQAGLKTRKALGYDEKYPFPFREHPCYQGGESWRWDFSTNGIYWAGKAGIPCIGFAPSDEVYAHTVEDRVPLGECVDATAFYALLPAVLAGETSGR